MPRLLTSFVFLLGISGAFADDWPQWMGPHRDNVWRESDLLEKFPAGGPKVLWRTPIAGGYAGPAVANGLVFVTDYVTADDVKVDNFARKEFTGQERVLCLDEASGAVKWQHEYAVNYTISYPAGPRTTPIIHDGKVYTLGAEGRLICFQASSGEILWSKELRDEYHTKSALWGYSSQPLIDGDNLILLAGGDGTHCVALNRNSGQEVWRTGTAKEQGYSPPIIFEQAGVRQLVLTSPQAVYAVEPATGKQLWSQPYDADNGSIIMTPVKIGNYLFVGGFNNRNLLLELTTDKPGATTVWKDKTKHAMSPINVQPFLLNGLLYGMDSSGELRCVEFPSGEIKWATPQPLGQRKVGSGTVFLVREGETSRFWMFAESGDLVIGELSPEGFKELDRTHLLEPTNNAFGRQVVWCAPAFANRRMFVRNDNEIICVNLAK